MNKLETLALFPRSQKQPARKRRVTRWKEAKSSMIASPPPPFTLSKNTTQTTIESQLTEGSTKKLATKKRQFWAKGSSSLFPLSTMSAMMEKRTKLLFLSPDLRAGTWEGRFKRTNMSMIWFWRPTITPVAIHNGFTSKFQTLVKADPTNSTSSISSSQTPSITKECESSNTVSRIAWITARDGSEEEKTFHTRLTALRKNRAETTTHSLLRSLFSIQTTTSTFRIAIHTLTLIWSISLPSPSLQRP